MLSNGQTSEQRAEYNRNYYADPLNRAKRRARCAVSRAVRRGQLERQPCEKCANPKTHAHHDDYFKPLDVRWLCHFCHAAEHRDERSPVKGAGVATHCARGHALAGENLFISRGWRGCRECNRKHQRDRYWKRKAAGIDRKSRSKAA